MTRHLFLLRHGKSSWSSDAATDFERPLGKRGKRDAPLVGRWMKRQGLVPEYVISSPATRASATAVRACRELGIGKSAIASDRRIYAAGLDDLLAVLADCPHKAGRVLLVGHNPGLEYLVAYLWGDETEVPEDGKLMPTAALAHLKLPDDWQGLESGSGRMVSITRPAALAEGA